MPVLYVLWVERDAVIVQPGIYVLGSRQVHYSCNEKGAEEQHCLSILMFYTKPEEHAEFEEEDFVTDIRLKRSLLILKAALGA